MATTVPLAVPTRRVLGLARLSDERLAGRVAGGDAAAFSAIYERYHQPLFRLCLAILRHESDAQDALQSTFERALSALERGRRDAPLRPWLYRIAHNEAITIHRRRRWVEPLENVSDAVVVPAADEVAARRASLATLLADLADLPERARSALVLRELSGLSHEDIAAVLGVSPGAAKQAIFEARRALAEVAEGRLMSCEDVQRVISDGDGRALRGRRPRAHLRDCAGCRAFAAAIPARRAELHALTPALGPVAAAAILARTLGSGSAAAPASMSGVVGTGLAGKTLIGAGAKVATLMAVLGTVGGVAVVTHVLPHRAATVRHAGVATSRAAPSGRSAISVRVERRTPSSVRHSETRVSRTTRPATARPHRGHRSAASAHSSRGNSTAVTHGRALGHGSNRTSRSVNPGRHRAVGHAKVRPARPGQGHARAHGRAHPVTSGAGRMKHSPHSS